MATLQFFHQQYRELCEINSGYFEAQLPILAETETAICFDKDSSVSRNREVPVWIPKSQMKIVEFETASDYVKTRDCDSRYFIKNWLRNSLN